uniref:Conserved oligomeric Golgi complex subunit 5 n=1 Tax=Panagrellus redivivus TaxID=6233 RepID=A0A7E4W7U5_PANRE
MSSAQEIENYVNGKIDEDSFLSAVVKNRSLDDRNVLSIVESVCATLNINLRQEIESNSNRLVEQAGSIDTLDAMHKMVHSEVRDAARMATDLGSRMKENFTEFQQRLKDFHRLRNLHNLLQDQVRVDNLIAEWDKVDFTRQADILVELRKIVAENANLRRLQWYRDDTRFRIENLTRSTKDNVIKELYHGLDEHDSLNVNHAVMSLFTINKEMAEQEFTHIVKKGVEEIDAVLKIVALVEEPAEMQATLEKHQLALKLDHWLVQLQLIDNDLAKRFGERLGKIIGIRLNKYSHAIVYVLNVLHTCANHLRSDVAVPIKEALYSIDTLYADERYVAITKTIDDLFKQGNAHRGTGFIGIREIFQEELDKARFDPVFHQMMYKIVRRAIQYVASQAEFMIESTNHQWTFGRMSRVQSQNYNILNMVYQLSQQFPDGRECFQPMLDLHKSGCLKSISVLVRMVLESMYQEDFSKSAPKSAASPYMAELCDHLSSFSNHFHCLHMLCTPVEEIHDFATFVVEQFLLHISLVKPFNQNAAQQFAVDLRFLINVFMKHFTCRTSNYINARTSLFKFVEELPDSAKKPILSVAVPQWFLLTIIISNSNGIPMPFESVSWSRAEYVKWFIEENEQNRYDFFRNLISANEKKADPEDAAVMQKLLAEWNKTFESK